MMRALAELIMRGRVQAALIAVIGGWVPLLSQSTIGLVTMRKGWQEGLLVSLWASTPIILALCLSASSQMMVFGSLAIIIAGYVGAYVLRITVSWSSTIGVMAVVSAVMTMLLMFFYGDSAVTQVRELFAQFYDLQSANLGLTDTQIADAIDRWNANKIAGCFAAVSLLNAVMGLFISRWWQALLYNPGGFRQEFYRLRLAPPLALVSAFAFVVCMGLGEEYQFWGVFTCVPLVVAGLSLVHNVVAKFRLGAGAIVASYVALLLLPLTTLLLVMAALSDIWLDYRKRFNLVQ